MTGANATRAADSTHHAAQATLTLEGERRAEALLERIAGGMAHPDELAVIVAYLQGELLHGICHLVQKVLEAHYGK